MTQTNFTSPIPTNLILGFLGVGKTTAILDLLRHKPADERWAVLVNEFGEVGIDGSLLENHGAWVREVPGGCMCCVAGLPMQIGLNQLIHKARPDRLLIEPTGLGHPAQILDILGNEHYRDVLRLGPVLTLVDPRRLEEPRVMSNVQFLDQVAAADVLVANKTDLCTEDQIAAFRRWADTLAPAKSLVTETRQGQLNRDWLQGGGESRPLGHVHAHAHHHARSEPESPVDINQQPWQCLVNQGQGYTSVGWRIHPDSCLTEDLLLDFAQSREMTRLKGVVRTERGWRAINLADGVVSVTAAASGSLSRLELIVDQQPAVEVLDQQLRACVQS